LDSLTEQEAEALGTKIGVDWETAEFTPADLLEGMSVELEHGSQDPETNVTNDEPLATAKIAVAHLRENARYYKLLKQHVETAE
jgi:hypothetical protein